MASGQGSCLTLALPLCRAVAAALGRARRPSHALITHVAALHYIKDAAMSWAALNKRLRGLLPRFSLPNDLAAAVELGNSLQDLVKDGGPLARMQRSGLKPSELEAEALIKCAHSLFGKLRCMPRSGAEHLPCVAANRAAAKPDQLGRAAHLCRRTVGMACARITDLGSSISDGIDGSATAAMVTAACDLMGACTHVCECTADVLQPALDFLGWAQFLLRCGVAAQRYAAMQVGRASVRPGQLGCMLDTQLLALDAWLRLVWCLPDSTELASGAVECAPPAMLQQWLAQALTSLRLLEPHWKPGEWSGLIAVNQH